jgi:hypothetical protein
MYFELGLELQCRAEVEPCREMKTTDREKAKMREGVGE